MNPPSQYPRELERTLPLANGRELYVRPIVPADSEHIRHGLATGDPATLASRFFTPNPKLSDAAIRYLAEVDYDKRLALIAFAGDEPVAVARYEGEPGPPDAEFAVVVHPDWRRLGIATALTTMIRDAARAHGYGTLTAIYLPDNDAVAAMLRRVGFVPGPVDRGIVEATLDLRAA